MSKRYDEYLDRHVANVKKAYQYLVDNSIVPDNKKTKYIISRHDLSKDTDEEYYAYDNNFYNTEFPIRATDIQKALMLRGCIIFTGTSIIGSIGFC